MELVPIYSTPVWMSVFQEFDDYQEIFLSCVTVETNNHDDERISISFNVIALPKGVMQVENND
jgi:hypothetical protein